MKIRKEDENENQPIALKVLLLQRTAAGVLQRKHKAL